MNQRKQFYITEEAASKILRQLDEDVHFNTELDGCYGYGCYR